MLCIKNMRRKQKYDAGLQVETVNLVDRIEQRTLDRKRAQASSNFAKRAPKKKAKCVDSVVLRPDDVEPVAALEEGDLEEKVAPAELDAAVEEQVDEGAGVDSAFVQEFPVAFSELFI